MPDKMPEDMPDRMPDGMADRMSDRMPVGMPDKVPECLPDRMPEDLPDRVPEDMPEQIAEDMPARMPEDMPDRMPEDMPDKMPEGMSDRMPEDLPVTKCINVMVGITRSKVIPYGFPPVGHVMDRHFNHFPHVFTFIAPFGFNVLSMLPQSNPMITMRGPPVMNLFINPSNPY